MKTYKCRRYVKGRLSSVINELVLTDQEVKSRMTQGPAVSIGTPQHFALIWMFLGHTTTYQLIGE